MCVIAGYILDDGRQPELLRAIARRSPIAARTTRVATRGGARAVRLAHRRLPIIDLEAGRQPTTNEDGRVRIVFSGET